MTIPCGSLHCAKAHQQPVVKASFSLQKHLDELSLLYVKVASQQSCRSVRLACASSHPTSGGRHDLDEHVLAGIDVYLELWAHLRICWRIGVHMHVHELRRSSSRAVIELQMHALQPVGHARGTAFLTPPDLLIALSTGAAQVQRGLHLHVGVGEPRV